MKSKYLKEFRKELSEAERFGSAAVRMVMEEAMEKWGGDPEALAALATHCMDRAFACWEDELTGIWLLLYDQIWYYARNHLNREKYHHFCELLL